MRRCSTAVIRLSLVTILLLCTQKPLLATEWNPDAIPKNLPSFLLGFAGGIAIHEMGHMAVASAEGDRVGYDGLSLVYSPQFASRSDWLRVSTAGFQAQWLATEAAFYYREKAPDLAIGVISSHIAITAAYLTFLKNNPQGDTVGASRASGLSTNQLILAAAVPALLDGWRLFGTDIPAWVAPLSIGFKGGCMTAIWAY